MLGILRNKLASEPLDVQERVDLVQGDMRAFDLGRKFSLVTMPFRPFQHLITVEEQLACLNVIHHHLADRGRLVFDLFNPDLSRLAEPVTGEEHDDDETFPIPDGRTVQRRWRITRRDLLHQVQDVELIYIVTYPDGRTERLVDAFPMRYLFRYEAEHLSVRAGFAVEAVYADYDRNPYGTKYPGEMIFVARKG